jgi:hypothetical protein
MINKIKNNNLQVSCGNTSKSVVLQKSNEITYAIQLRYVRYKSESCSWWCVLNTTVCDKICQWLAVGRWVSLCTLIIFTNKTDRHDINEILLKVALNTFTLCLSVMLDSLSCSFTSISFLTNIHCSLHVVDC